MKQSPNFIVSDVAGKHLLMPMGRAVLSLDGMIALNDMGLTIWKLLAKDTSYEDLLKQILSEFDIDEKTADLDVKAFLAKLQSVNAIVN